MNFKFIIELHYHSNKSKNKKIFVNNFLIFLNFKSVKAYRSQKLILISSLIVIKYYNKNSIIQCYLSQ